MMRWSAWAGVALALGALVACSSDDGGDAAGGAGASATGGEAGTGGASGSGGASETGGADGATGGVGPGLEPVPECAEEFVPCDADPTGTWTLVSICGVERPPELVALCPSAELIVSRAENTGTIELGADGSFVEDWSSTVTGTLVIPGECIESLAGGVTVTCGAVELLLGARDLAATCSDLDDGGCACATELSESGDSSGTWELDGDVLVISGVERGRICVEGDLGRLEEDREGIYSLWER